MRRAPSPRWPRIVEVQLGSGTAAIRILDRFGPRGGAGMGGASARAGLCCADAVRWHEAASPASLALCSNSEFDGYVARELNRVAEAATCAASQFGLLAVMLTGSLARGEGVLVRGPDGRARWLSDIDCLVVVSKRGNLCGALVEALTQATAALKADATKRSTGLNIQLTPIASARLKDMRPTIFNRELTAHGKLLWGRPLMTSIAAPAPDDRRARQADALRLLNNRIMEQVSLREASEAGKAAAAQRAYGLSKLWTGLATSLSVFLDCYRTTYRERHLALRERLVDPQSPLDCEIAGSVQSGLDAAMACRRGEFDAAIWPEDKGFALAAEMAQGVWDWESARMLERPEARIDSDWRAVPRRLRRTATLAERGRDWARWCLRPDVSRRMGLRALVPALRSGSPGNAIYAAGCLMEFFWDEITERRGEGREIARTLGSMFGLNRGLRDLPARRQLVERAVAAWRSHLGGGARSL